MPNMDSIQLKVKELLRFHSGCHGDQVTIATKYLADAYHPKVYLSQYPSGHF